MAILTASCCSDGCVSVRTLHVSFCRFRGGAAVTVVVLPRSNVRRYSARYLKDNELVKDRL